MKTIISNTSPLRYLTCIGEHDLLPQLFRKVLDIFPIKFNFLIYQ